ncbi:MAG: LacI family DNA-binding transcriptional regulator [Pseudomonadota bacterium]
MAVKVTLRDVAAAAGVAESTASRALAGSGQLSADTRQRIIDAAAQLGYETGGKLAPQPLDAPRRRGVIGVVVAALNNSFYPYLVDRLHNDLDDLGFDMVLIIDEITRDRAGRKLRTLIDTLDGVIVTTAMIGSPMVDFLVDRGVPTVLAIRSNMQNTAHVVESDNIAAGAEALAHLVSLAHRRIGLLMGPANTSTTVGRLQGARMVLERSGLTVDDDLVFHTEFTHEGGYSGCVQLMRAAKPPSALFCANDVIAIGALDAARKMGIDVPGALSIIGVDDIPMASWSMISLTTVRQPIGEIGAMAAKLVSEAVAQGTVLEPKSHIFPTNLLVRATTGPAKTG